MKNIIDFIGRLFISFIFLFEAYDSIKFSKTTKEVMTSYGLTWKQDLLLTGAIIFLILGGLMILSGYRARLGAVLLLFYWVPVTFIVHSFWNDPPEIARGQSILFMKNISIVGGLLMVWVHGVGKFGIKRLFATFRVPNA